MPARAGTAPHLRVAEMTNSSLRMPRQDPDLRLPTTGGAVNLTQGIFIPDAVSPSDSHNQVIQPCLDMTDSTGRGWVNGTIQFDMRLDFKYELAPLVRQAEEANVHVTQIVFHGLRYDPRIPGWITNSSAPDLLLGHESTTDKNSTVFSVPVWDIEHPSNRVAACGRVTYVLDLKSLSGDGQQNIDHLYFRDIQIPPSRGDLMGVTAMWVVVEPNQSSGSPSGTRTNNSQPSGNTNKGSGSVSAATLVAALVTPTVVALLCILAFVCFRRHRRRKQHEQLMEEANLNPLQLEASPSAGFYPDAEHLSSPLILRPPLQAAKFPLTKVELARRTPDSAPSYTPSAPSSHSGSSRTGPSESGTSHNGRTATSSNTSAGGSPVPPPRRLPPLPEAEAAPEPDQAPIIELVGAMQQAGFTVHSLLDRLRRRPPSPGMSDGGMTSLPAYDQTAERRPAPE